MDSKSSEVTVLEDKAITPKTITELKQVTPDEISSLAENVMEADKVMTQSTEELEHLSACLSNLSATKDKYDRVGSQVKKQMRALVTRV